MILNPRLFLLVLLLAWVAGCARMTAPSSVAGAVLDHVTLDQHKRSYWLYAPGNSIKPRPLLVVLHEAGSSGGAMIRLGHFAEDAASKGYLLAAPNAEGGAFDYSTAGGDDVAFISGLIDRVRHKYDVSAVYVVGYGTGGAMALRLALAIPNRLQGVASVAGQLSPPPKPGWKQNAPTLPVMIMMGDQDPLLAGPGVAPADTVREWAKYFGCSTSVAASVRMIRQTGWYGCRNNVTVALMSISGLGHHWPGGNQADEIHPAGHAPGPYIGNLHATDIIWDFLTRIAPGNRR